MAKAKKTGEAILSTGRRKESVARVRLLKGTGNIIVNNKPLDDYFPAGNYTMLVRQPLKAIEFNNEYDVLVNVYGGGLSGQAGAIRHGISRAFAGIDEKFHKILKSFSYLTRDPRMVERKKYGQKKARKRFQFSKR